MYRIFRLLLASMVVCTLLGTFTSPALANTIEKDDYVFADVWQPYTCANGQKIIEDYAFFVNVRNFYDKNGEFFMLEESVTQTGKIYLEDQPWKVIYTAPFQFQLRPCLRLPDRPAVKVQPE